MLRNLREMISHLNVQIDIFRIHTLFNPLKQIYTILPFLQIVQFFFAIGNEVCSPAVFVFYKQIKPTAHNR